LFGSSLADGYDLVVVGAGTGANGVARACAHEGLKVATVDSLPYGGTCALRGCDPKKMLVGVTESLDWAIRVSDKGLRAGPMGIDWPELIAFKRTFTDPMPARLEKEFQEAGIETLHGQATFVGPRELRVGDRALSARHIHIATGARPATLGIPGEELVMSSTGFLELPELPRRVAFIGGGFISFEFAHVARRAGAAEVTILHRGTRPLVRFDPDLVDLQVARTRELGIDVRLESCVLGVDQQSDGLRVTYEHHAGSGELECDLVVHGAGRVPNLEMLDLDAGGVEAGPRGISVLPSMRSASNPAVFAAGDCADTQAPNLTPVASYEGRIATKNILAGADVRQAEYPPIPSAVFTIPPIAAVGLLEEEARAQGLDVDARFRQTGTWYSSLRVAEPHSAFKVLVEHETGRIVGAHVMGPGAEEQINLFAMAMGAGLTADQVKGVMFAYPSYASDIASMV
jgi:glutathione reductase (NADPH)